MSSLVATEQIIVAFTGEGDGIEEMSWGQWEIWHAMVAQQSALPIGGSAPVAPGTTIEDVAEELRFLMTRYQPLRTKLVFDANGRPMQHVHGSGEIGLEVFDANDGDDPAALAFQIHEGYSEKPFDYAEEWPVRMAVVRHQGMATHLVATMSHLTMDGFGGMIMLEEVVQRPETPVDGMQPLEQARWQRSPAGQRHNDLAMRHWGQQLRAVPLGLLDDASGAQVPRYWEGRLRSVALCLAVRALGERTKVDSSAILLALFAIALSRKSGVTPVFTRPVVSNRFRPRLSNVVCMLAQAGLVTIDVTGATVDEVIARSQRAAMTAYKYAYFDPERLVALMAEVAKERGPGFTTGCFFNDRRVSSRTETSGPPPAPAELDAAVASSTFGWVTKQDTPFDRLFLHIDDVPGLLQLTLAFDTHYVSPQLAEAVLRDLEEIAVAAAFDQGYKVSL